MELMTAFELQTAGLGDAGDKAAQESHRMRDQLMGDVKSPKDVVERLDEQRVAIEDTISVKPMRWLVSLSRPLIIRSC